MIFITTQAAWGESTDSQVVEDASNTRLPFRRAYVPKEMLPEIPTQGETYWPIPAEEFELWAMQESRKTPENARVSRTVFAEEAVYEAKLIENQFFTGKATFRLRKLPTLTRLGVTPTLTGNGLSYTWDFPPVSFAFDNFLNVHSDAKLPFSLRNFRFDSSGAGEVALHKDDFRVDGVLTETLSPGGVCEAELIWSQRVAHAGNDELRLDLAWIPATDTQYVFTLPEEWIPETNEGIITLDLAEKQNENGEKIENAGNTTAWRTWRISFGGKRRATVIFRRKDAPKLKEALISVSQKNIYQFRKEGLDVFVKMDLNPLLKNAQSSTKQTRELRVFLENQLIPQKIRFNETEVPWKSDAKTSPEDKTVTGVVVTIFLPHELQGTGNRLEINAIGNLDAWLAEGMTGLRALPRVQLINSLRQECRTEAQIYAPLEIVDFSLKDAVMLANQRKPGLEQTQLVFIEYSDSAKFEMTLARLAPKIQIDQATAIDFQEHEISAVMELQASVASGECFEILGIVDRSWTIDSVESGNIAVSTTSGKSSAAGTIEDWDFDASPENVRQALSDLEPAGALPDKLTASGWNLESLGILRIQLARSIRPGRPISLKIRARRLGYANNFTFTGIQLAPLYFPTFQIGQSWLLFGSSTAWKIHFVPPYREQDVYWTGLSTNAESRFALENVESAIQATGTVAEKTKTENVGAGTDAKMKIGTETAPKPESSGLLKPFDGFNTPSTENTKNTPTERQSLLAEAQKSFPKNMMFLTGIQDFKNVPMIRLEHAAKTFTAEIHGFYDITPSPNSMFRIKCDPQGTELERMRIVIRPGALLGVTWKFPQHLSGINPACLERQPLEHAEEVNASYELWELRFPQPQREPFEFELILATTEDTSQNTYVDNDNVSKNFWRRFSTERTILEEAAFVSDAQYSWWRKRFPDGFRLPLLDVIDAQKCTGTITLRNDVTDSILTEAQEMIPVLLPMEEAIEFKPENAEDCCRYSYEPHTVSNSPGPRLTLIWREKKVAMKKAWIWELERQSQFFTNGKILHSARFNIENIDAYQLIFTLENPKKRKINFLGILVNGHRIPVELLVLSSENAQKTENIASDNGMWNHPASGTRRRSARGTKKDVIQHKYRLRIPFPLWRKQSEIVIQWLETVPPWQLCASLTLPKISVDLPVLQKNWKVWIPESYVPLRFSIFERPSQTSLMSANPATAEGDDSITKTGNGRNWLPKDTIFLRLFGTLRLGKSIFVHPKSLAPGKIDSPITLDAQTIRELSSEKFSYELGTTFQNREQRPYTLVGWNEYAQDKMPPIFVIYGNALESVRWFLLLFVCFLASWLLAGRRIIRVLACGISGTLCMVAPMVWTPVFSGIFLGVAASYLGSSARHHLRHATEISAPVILVKKNSSSRRLSWEKTGNETQSANKTENEDENGTKNEKTEELK